MCKYTSLSFPSFFLDKKTCLNVHIHFSSANLWYFNHNLCHISSCCYAYKINKTPIINYTNNTRLPSSRLVYMYNICMPRVQFIKYVLTLSIIHPNQNALSAYTHKALPTLEGLAINSKLLSIDTTMRDWACMISNTLELLVHKPLRIL